MKRVYLVRHGQTEGNVGRYFQDEHTVLTEKGHGQAMTTGERLTHVELGALVASPMKRAQQTAEHVSDALGIPVETCDDFHECLQPVHIRGLSKDDGEGLEFNKKYLEYYQRDEVFAEGFENFNLVTQRARRCAEFIKSHKAENMVIVSHCAFIHSFASFLLLQEESCMKEGVILAGSLDKMSNASITEFTYSEGRWHLVTWNDNAHFAE